MVRRLALLACPEPVENMHPVAGGAHCDRCDLVVRHTEALSEAEAMDLFERAGAQRVCVRIRVRGDRVHLAGGAIAGLSMAVLSACCATPDDEWAELREAEPSALLCEGEDSGGDCEFAIFGRITSTSGDPVSNALVVVHASTLSIPLETYSNNRGIYGFRQLPRGAHTVQVLVGRARLAKIIDLQDERRMRVNFTVDPDDDEVIILVGMLERPMIDPTSASSTLIVR
jgi:hypothetical protein